MMDNPLIFFFQLHKAIPEADQQLISAAFKMRIFKEDETLFAGGGAICKELFFICKGVLRININTEDGRQVTHYFLRENQFCSILNSFNNQLPAEEVIAAACDAEVLSISRAKLWELYRQLPYLQELITQITHQSLLDKINIRNAYLGKDATEQYKLFLTQQPDIATRVSIGDIASYLNITPQSLSRIRKNLH